MINGKLESDSTGVTNGVCDSSEGAFTTPTPHSTDEQLPLSAGDFNSPLDSDLHDGDILNGNYVSPGTDVVSAPLTPMSQSSEELAQRPITSDAGISGDKTPSSSKSSVVSAGELVHSPDVEAAAEPGRKADYAVADVRQSASPAKKSAEVGDKTASDAKPANAGEAAVGEASPIVTHSTEVPALQSLGVNRVSVNDESLLRAVEPPEPAASSVEETASFPVSEKHFTLNDEDSQNSIPKVSSIARKAATEQPEETAAEGFTVKLPSATKVEELFPVSNKDITLKDDDSKESTQKLPSAEVARKTPVQPEDFAALGLTAERPSTAEIEELEKRTKSSDVAEMPTEEPATCAETIRKGAIPVTKEVPCKIASDVDDVVGKSPLQIADDRERIDSVSSVSRESQFSNLPQELEDSLVDMRLQMEVQHDAQVATGTQDEGYGGAVAEQEGTSFLPVSKTNEPGKPLTYSDVSDIADRLGEIAVKSAESASADYVENVFDSGKSDVGRACEESNLSAALTGHDIESDDVEKRERDEMLKDSPVVDGQEMGIGRSDDEGMMIGTKHDHEDDDDDGGLSDVTDKVDSTADDVDEDATSSQVAPRSVKMQEAARGKPAGGATGSAVVCARPSKRSVTRSSSDGSAQEDAAPEVPRVEEKEVLEDSAILGGEELGLEHSATEEEIARTENDDISVVADSKNLDSRPSDVDFRGTATLQPSEEASTSHVKVAGSAPDFPCSVASKTRDELPTVSQQDEAGLKGSDRTEPPRVDTRQTEAGQSGVRSREVRRQTDANDDKVSATQEPRSAVGAVAKGESEGSGVGSMSKAVKTGLMAVVAAPYLAGVAIADALKSDSQPATSHSHISHDQRRTESSRTLTEEPIRIPLVGEQKKVVSGFVEDKPSRSSEPDLQRCLDQDLVRHPPHHRSEIEFQQPLVDQKTEVAGAKQPVSSESLDDGAVHLTVKTEPLLPVVASTQPSEMPAALSLPAAVSSQSSALISDTVPSPMQTVSPAADAEVSKEPTAASVPLVTRTVQATVSTAASPVPSASPTDASPSTTVSSDLFEVPLQSTGPDFDSIQRSTKTSKDSVFTLASTVSPVAFSQPELITTQSTIPPTEPFSDISKLAEESLNLSLPTPAVDSTFVPRLPVTPQDSAVTVSPTQQFTVFVQSTTITKLPAEATLPSIPSTGTQTQEARPVLSHPYTVTSQSTDQTVVVAASVLPCVTSKEVDQPSSTNAELAALTAHSSTVPTTSLAETVQSIVPSTQPLAETTESTVAIGTSSLTPASTSVTAGLVAPSDNANATVTSTTGSSLMMSQLPVVSSAQQPDITLPSVPAASAVSKLYPKPSVVKPSETLPISSTLESVADEVMDKQAEKSTADYSAAELQESLNKQKRVEDDDEAIHIVPNDGRTPTPATEDEVSSSDRTRSPFHDDDSGKSSVTGSVKKALRVGLMGAVGAPVLAGMAIADALRSKSNKKEMQGPEAARSAQGLHTDNAVISQGQLEPVNVDFGNHGIQSRDDEEELSKSVRSAGQPVDIASAVVGTDRGFGDAQAAFQTHELQPRVRERDVDIELHTGKELKHKAEMPASEPVPTNEVGDMADTSLPPGLSLSEVLLSPLYDQQHNCFVDPKTGRQISLASAVQLGLVDGSRKVIADLRSGEVISILEALDRGIIDRETGMVSVDGETTVPLNEALASGLIMDDADSDLLEMAATAGDRVWNEATDAGELHPTVRPQSSRQPFRPLKLVQLLDLGLYSPISGEFRDPRSAVSLSLADAIRFLLLDKDSVVINDPQSEEVFHSLLIAKDLMLCLQLYVVYFTETAAQYSDKHSVKYL